MSWWDPSGNYFNPNIGFDCTLADPIYFIHVSAYFGKLKTLPLLLSQPPCMNSPANGDQTPTWNAQTIRALIHKRFWKHPCWFQIQIVLALYKGKDVIAIVPTGASAVIPFNVKKLKILVTCSSDDIGTVFCSSISHHYILFQYWSKHGHCHGLHVVCCSVLI